MPASIPRRRHHLQRRPEPWNPRECAPRKEQCRAYHRAEHLDDWQREKERKGEERESERNWRMWRVLLLLTLILKDMLHFMRHRQISGCGVLGLQRAAIKRSARATNGARASNTFASLPTCAFQRFVVYSQINRGRSTRHMQEERRLRFVVRYSHEIRCGVANK